MHGGKVRLRPTGRPDESPEEWEAKWVVAEALGGLPIRREGPGHDYDIEGGSRKAALEVTKSAPQERMALRAAINRIHQRECPHITTHWRLTIPDARPELGFRGPDLDAIFKKAPPRLRLLEEHGAPAFGVGYEHLSRDVAEAVRTAISEMLALEILTGQSQGPLLPREHPLLLIGTRGEWGASIAEPVIESVERAAARKARQLLAAQGVHKRHLFVVIDPTDYAAHSAFTTGAPLPGRPPTLPEGIDTVWLGAWIPRAWHGCDISPIWRVTPTGPWVRVQVNNPHAYAARFGEDTALRSEEESFKDLERSLNEHARQVRGNVGRSIFRKAW